jgi:hypothetical protein
LTLAREFSYARSPGTVKTAIITTTCECQARLGAGLDDSRHVVRGWARDRRRRAAPAPAHAIAGSHDHFDVGWQCPFCTRNVLRSFCAEGLAWREGAPGPASTPN